MAKKYTHCDICLAACGMEVEVEENRIVALRGDKDHPLTRGFLCPKGMASHEMVTDPLRLRHPYERTGDKWNRITWQEAYQKISRRLRELISKHGRNSVALYYGGGNATSSVNYMLADGFLRALGSDRIFNVLTLEFTNRYLVMEKMYGKQFFVTQPDLDQTDCLLIFGSNPMVSLDHPGIVASLKDLKKRGAKLFVVDPRKTETGQMADIHVDILPGTDLYMLRGIHSHIFGKDLQNKEFLERHCVGGELLRHFPEVTPEDAARICGVPAEVITRIAEEFALARSASAVCKLGINVSTNCTLTYWLVEALNAVTGNVDKPGGLLFNPKNYYRLLLGGMGKVKFGRLMENPHGVKAGDIRFGAALKRMATPSKKIEVAPPEFVEALKRVSPLRERSDRFPLMLITGERSPHTKNTQLRGVTSLTKKQSGNFLRISSVDAASASINEADLVEVATEHGAVTVQALVTDDIRPGVVSLTHGWGRKLFHPETLRTEEHQGTNANLLTDDEHLDELCGMPIYNAIPCSVHRNDG